MGRGMGMGKAECWIGSTIVRIELVGFGCTGWSRHCMSCRLGATDVVCPPPRHEGTQIEAAVSRQGEVLRREGIGT